MFEKYKFSAPTPSDKFLPFFFFASLMTTRRMFHGSPQYASRDTCKESVGNGYEIFFPVKSLLADRTEGFFARHLGGWYARVWFGLSSEMTEHRRLLLFCRNTLCQENVYGGSGAESISCVHRWLLIESFVGEIPSILLASELSPIVGSYFPGHYSCHVMEHVYYIHSLRHIYLFFLPTFSMFTCIVIYYMYLLSV